MGLLWSNICPRSRLLPKVGDPDPPWVGPRRTPLRVLKKAFPEELASRMHEAGVGQLAAPLCIFVPRLQPFRGFIFCINWIYKIGFDNWFFLRGLKSKDSLKRRERTKPNNRAVGQPGLSPTHPNRPPPARPTPAPRALATGRRARPTNAVPRRPLSVPRHRGMTKFWLLMQLFFCSYIYFNPSVFLFFIFKPYFFVPYFFL